MRRYFLMLLLIERLVSVLCFIIGLLPHSRANSQTWHWTPLLVVSLVRNYLTQCTLSYADTSYFSRRVESNPDVIGRYINANIAQLSWFKFNGYLKACGLSGSCSELTGNTQNQSEC